MNQQQIYSNERVEQWAIENGFNLSAIEDVVVKLKRISDGYPMDVNKRLLMQLITDDENGKGSK